MTYTDEEIRHQTIDLLTLETERDQQKRVGASNLSNGCDFCLTSELLGQNRVSPLAERPWGGRVIGTAIHGLLETNGRKKFIQEIAAGRVLIEHRLKIGILGSYGEIGSTLDFARVDENHLIDYKSTEDKKSGPLRDELGQTNFGRTHAKVKLSEKEYADKRASGRYKTECYHRQLHLYGRGLVMEGYDIERVSASFISRDSTMYFDNPALDGYSDPGKMHGVWVLSFDYDAAFAEQLWAHRVALWEALQNGAIPDDFARHPQCFTCSTDQREEQNLAAKVTSMEAALAA